MTAIESLPHYAEAEAAARSRGRNLIDMLGAYLAGVADMGDVPNYLSDDVLPDETVCQTRGEVRAHMSAIIEASSRV